jgi:hypothetical protein
MEEVRRKKLEVRGLKAEAFFLQTSNFRLLILTS